MTMDLTGGIDAGRELVLAVLPEVPETRDVRIPWLDRLVTRGDDVSFELETLDGERIAIGGETYANVRSRGAEVLPPDFPVVQQAHARFDWNGETTTGMVERSSMPDKITEPLGDSVPDR